ncbi:hypothetical protein R1sor_010580 [Riccia sorocarpa]|uniref:Uncharacterized protein n=1 Tax=Riccia sorocarpa TaxID=122646 RepID=A0ABD3I0C5_9MARC
MVPENTPADETDSEGEPFPVTQTPKVQPLSALSEVELNRDEKNQIRRVAITRCLVDQSVLRIPTEQFHVTSCDSNSENWGPYQIRACSRSFVSDLKKHMQSNAYAHYHNFILLVDPRDCKDKTSWVFAPPSKWRFYVIGGNHSALARMELLAQYPGIYTHYRHCNCIVYAGLSKTEASLFAHDDNFDAEVRRKYTFHQRVEYFHRQFMEAKQTGEPIATLRKRLALEIVNIGEEDSKTALSTLEGTFQVAFRTGRLWEVQESIFRKWERKELKSMKAAGKGKKKDDGEMRQTWWRPLQGVSDERKLSILLRVDSGELSLDQMRQECARRASLQLREVFDLMLKDRSSSNSITKALFGVDEPEPEGGKRKRASKAKSLVQVLPPKFLDHIDSARAYKEAKETGQVTRGHKHSKDIAPPTCDGEASLVEKSVPVTVDDVIRLEKDQVPGSVGTGGSEADDGIDDPEGIDPGVHAEEAEEAEEEVPEHEVRLGEEGVVPDSIVAE